MNVSFFQEILTKIAERGRQILDFSPTGSEEQDVMENLCHALMSSKGEALGVALARNILNRYVTYDNDNKNIFFSFLAMDLNQKTVNIENAARAYLDKPDQKTLDNLIISVESPRRELFRRLNLAPGGTAILVKMRQDLFPFLKKQTEFYRVDKDLGHLFSLWFNRGFLVLVRISWSTPASILEKIIDYEAVHEIKGWDDLRRRLAPEDRRCFAFFHPALVDDPLIFVEVALEKEIPYSIHALLESDAHFDEDNPEPTVAVFYSISNCQDGLRGISFGNFLIKQVAEDLKKEIPSLRTFVTLSPVPSFKSWLYRALDSQQLDYLPELQRAHLTKIKEGGWSEDEAFQDAVEPAIIAAATHYFLLAKDKTGKPLDPVARFHLGNGASLERINWLGDTSEKGVEQSLSIMVNYRYELRDIERNHEAYVTQGDVAASKAVKSTLLAPEKSRSLIVTQVEG